MATLTFHSGVHDATGANFLLETEHARILIDCGLLQGRRFSIAKNCDVFPYNPADVDVLLVTHAHIDHIGRIPKLVRDGFRGKMYATEATRDLAQVMLRDALMVMREEAKREGGEACYDETDIAAAMQLFHPVSYGEIVPLPDGITATFADAGHILGSAIITLRRDGKVLVASGDIGNIPQPLLNPPTVPHGYDYLIMESVYGDRVHEDVPQRREKLLAAVRETYARHGTLIIPAFSLERTQGMLYELHGAMEAGDIPRVPVYLDSPLAIAVTEVYKKHLGYLREDVRAAFTHGDPFAFPGLHISRSREDSEEIHRDQGSKIIIAGSGMSHGGRILAHEQRYLPDPNAMVLLVGYQGVGTLGRLLQDGAKQVRLHGEQVRIRARVRMIDGYSAHADRDQLLDFVAEGGNNAKKIFVAMGEEKASLFLVQRLRDFLGLDAVAPAPGEGFTIEF